MKYLLLSVALAAAAAVVLMFSSCNLAASGASSEDAAELSVLVDSLVDTAASDELPTRELSFNTAGFRKTYLVACIADSAAIYKERVEPERALIVVSKREYRLYVYETGADTILAASFPVCYAIHTGQKSREGDNCTPECGMDNPFRVSEICNSSRWTYDFGDGRGSIKAFGKWFVRLDLSQSFPDNPALAANRTIAIHGATGNECSIPGRDSHGCVRLHDTDLITFRNNYVGVGTRVVIKSFHQGKLPFELKAERALGERYQAARLTPTTCE